jgi:hypothetical protein
MCSTLPPRSHWEESGTLLTFILCQKYTSTGVVASLTLDSWWTFFFEKKEAISIWIKQCISSWRRKRGPTAAQKAPPIAAFGLFC